MSRELTVTIDAWAYGDAIPEEYAFCVPAETACAMGSNISPAIRWSGAPGGTRSFALICHDPDVPSRADDVNKEGQVVPASLPRMNFFHWVLVDIPGDLQELAKGIDSTAIIPRGKPAGRTDHGLRGINNYTDWFASDEAMKGDYGGYDGPCPPWNDEIVHHYHFTVYALDVPSLGLSGRFGGPEALQAIEPHTLAKGSWMGTYTLNKHLRGG